jgi:hypothetical protein
MTSVIKKSDSTIYALLASSDTQYQILVPANYNHTFFVAEWVSKDHFTLAPPSQSGNFFSYKAADALGTVAEKLDQLHLK